ncbi:MAG: glycine oxidase ThiO [Candidatus Acidiferrales bacterium]
MSAHDVIVIGGGIIGGSIAWELARRGARPLLLDREARSQESSWAAAGMLQTAPDSAEVIPLVPLGRASLAMYPQFVADVEKDSGRKVSFRQHGAMEALFSADAERELSTLVALHHGIGLSAEPLPVEEALALEPALNGKARAAALMPDEAAVDNRALTEAVLEAAQERGAEFRGGAEVTAIEIRGGTAGKRVEGVVTRDGKRHAAKQVVLAAGCYSSRLEEARRFAPTRPVRGQMVGLRSSAPRLTRVLRSTRGYISPRNDENPQWLIAGSTLEHAGYEKRVTPDGLSRVLDAAQELIPELRGAEIIETWCGLRPDTPDHLPILGPTGVEGLLIATGHYRSGILLAPITAKLISEWIADRRVSFDWEVFSPLRFADTPQSL